MHLKNPHSQNHVDFSHAPMRIGARETPRRKPSNLIGKPINLIGIENQSNLKWKPVEPYPLTTTYFSPVRRLWMHLHTSSVHFAGEDTITSLVLLPSLVMQVSIYFQS